VLSKRSVGAALHVEVPANKEEQQSVHDVLHGRQKKVERPR
jgi:hypothetical protein